MPRQPATTGPLLVAGSVGPYGAMLADGSEYRGDYDPGAAALAAFHRPRIEALVEAGADLLAFETIPTIREAEVLVGLLDEVDAPGLAELLVPGRRPPRPANRSRTRSRSASIPRVVAVGVNCTAPRHLPGPAGTAPPTATDGR